MIKYTLTHSLFPNKSYDLHEGSNVIGRGHDFGIDCRLCSRRQAIIHINNPTSIYVESGGINPIFVKVQPWDGFVEIKKGDKIQIFDGSYISLYRNQQKEFQIYSLKTNYYQDSKLHSLQLTKSLSSSTSSVKSISDEENVLKTEPIKRKKIILDESEDDEDDDNTNDYYSKIQHKRSPNSIIYDGDDNDNNGSRSITVKQESNNDDDENDSKSKTRTLDDVLNSCEKISNEIKSFVNKDLTSVIETSKLNDLFSPYQLKNHQIIGVSWLYLFYCRNYNSVLADEMGLGKTIQTIGLLKYLYKVEHIKGPHLVVVPTSTLENWQREFNKWFKEFRVLKYHGSVDDKQEFRLKYSRSDSFDVLLITYSMFEKSQGSIDRQYLRKFHYKYMILDEAHFIRNANAQRYNRLCKINVEHKLLLTGTPFQNKLEELLNLLCFILPPTIIRRDEISDLCCERDEETVNTIKQIISPFILRRLKEEVLNDLVPKTLEILYLDMLEGQSLLYNKLIENYKQSKDRNDIKNGSNLFVDLRKTSNHPLLLRNWYDDNMCKKLAPLIYQSGYYGNECNYNKVYPELLKSSDFEIYEICKEYVDVIPELSRYIFKDDLILKSAKFQKLKILLPELIKNGHKILIFSQWTKILDLIELLLNILKIEFLRIDGTVGVDDRQNIIDTYQNDTEIKVLLLSSRACGIGINCTCADTVILHDVDFNPQVDIQAEDRCHRIGQDKPVTIYHLVCKDSVDELIKKKAIEKRKLEKSIFSNEENDDNKIIEEMLKSILLK